MSCNFERLNWRDAFIFARLDNVNDFVFFEILYKVPYLMHQGPRRRNFLTCTLSILKCSG